MACIADILVRYYNDVDDTMLRSLEIAGASGSTGIWICGSEQEGHNLPAHAALRTVHIAQVELNQLLQRQPLEGLNVIGLTLSTLVCELVPYWRLRFAIN